MARKHGRDRARIVGTRWVLDRKASGALKARLVVQGHQERGVHIHSDAPTGSADAMMLTVAFGAHAGWACRTWGAHSVRAGRGYFPSSVESHAGQDSATGEEAQPGLPCARTQAALGAAARRVTSGPSPAAPSTRSSRASPARMRA